MPRSVNHSNGVSNGQDHQSEPAVADNNGNGTHVAIDLHAEIDALKDVLRDAYTRTHRLGAAIRKHKKQAQLLKSTLASLRHLQQVEA